LCDHKGKQLWQSAKRSGVDDCAPGDVNGDGKLEFAVGYNGGGGVCLLDAQGKELWHKMDGNVWHVEILDINQDGRPEIVHSNAGGELTVRNAAGDIYYRAQTAGYFSHFSTGPWPTTAGPTRAIELDTGTVLVINADGSTAAKLSAPARKARAGVMTVRRLRWIPEPTLMQLQSLICLMLAM
jgi:outer membrane protein assembly factor BamB